MAGGTTHHWKHGWIPLDAWARKIMAGRKDRKPDPRGSASADDMAAYRSARRSSGSSDMAAYKNALADDRRQRYNANLAKNADKDAARRQRYLDNQNRNAAKNAAMEQRFRDHENAKNAKKTAGQMLNNFRGNETAGNPPATKVADRVQSGVPFTYDPNTGKVTGSFYKDTPTLEKETSVGGGFATGERRGDLEVHRAQTRNSASIVESLIQDNADAINEGYKIGGRPDGRNYLIGLVAP